MPQCRKCPYFQKEQNKYQVGKVILGFCRLRQKHISDQTITAELCKDRAVIDVTKQPKESGVWKAIDR